MFRHDKLDRKLFYRELQGNCGLGSTAGLYGSRAWVDRFDIVGELRGHDGCVNALDWNSNGSLLASGSDDHRVNIYKAYAGFSLNTQIETGHTENIFSVKFMPYSNDRTIISAAGDGQVRVFDIEYAPTIQTTLSASPIRTSGAAVRGMRRHAAGLSHPTPGKVQYNAHRVYRSHRDAVKRIITENSSYLFLTCSEDGSVRQFDLRQPSSAYNRPEPSSGSRGLMSFDVGDEDERNPPLISYARHQIDLNAISCSTSQPYYIALGGAHLYCFLHDRRMLGRDLWAEAGKRRPVAASSPEDIGLSAATRCVRRFSPKLGNNWDMKMQNSHITACKISDANPNEVLVSWSGDGAYLFDINRSPEPNEAGLGRDPWDPAERKLRLKQERDRKLRARRRAEAARSQSPPMPGLEDILPGSGMIKIAALVTDIRKELFGMASSNLAVESPDELEAEKAKSFQAALRTALVAHEQASAAIQTLEQRDLTFFDSINGVREISSVAEERRRRGLHAKARRRVRSFIHEAGCLAQALGGALEPEGDEELDTEIFDAFAATASTQFRSRFLNVLITYLDMGIQGVIILAQNYYEDRQMTADDEDEEMEVSPPTVTELLEQLFDDLEQGSEPTVLRGVDNNEAIYDTEGAMVTSFKRMVELELASSSSLPTTRSPQAKRFWGEKVARALLMKDAEALDFAYVDRAFTAPSEAEDEMPESNLDPQFLQELLGSDAEDGEDGEGTNDSLSSYHTGDLDDMSVDDDEDEDDEEDDDDDDDDDDINNEDDDMVDPDDEDGDIFGEDDDFWYRRRRNLRNPIEPQAPVFEHVKIYRGHRNVRTVKDINFYGLNDEYVVSGSDCGNLFIWNKYTTELIQLLHGDDDTVNVCIGHPSEPLLAVSGIDHTVKLFSSDRDLHKEPTRRRMDKKESITANNELLSENNVTGPVITRGMLAQLVARMREGGPNAVVGAAGQIPPMGEEGCMVM